jgi:hypothetical protein
MEKECCQIKFTETDEGFRIDVTGKNLKDAFCCMPVLQSCITAKAECCPTEKKPEAKKE